MSNYTPITDFSAKDALTTGDPEKIILGSDVDAETDAIATAIATKLNSSALDEAAGMLTDIRALTDPNDDRVLGWDDSAGAVISFDLSTGLTTSTTNLLIDTAVVPQLGSANTYTSTAAFTSAGDSNHISITAATVSSFYGSGTANARLGTSSNHGFEFYTNNTLVGSISNAGVWTLNGVAVSDFARLSQANGFTLNQTITHANDPALLITDTGSVEVFLQSYGTASFGLVGTNSNHPFEIWTNALSRFAIDASGNYNFKAGTVTTPNTTASEVGFKGAPQVTDADNYTLVLTDAGKQIFLTGNGHTLTIPANASVAFPVGTIIQVAVSANGPYTIAITTDSLWLAGTGDLGSRTLAAYGLATLTKVTANGWFIAGAGLS